MNTGLKDNTDISSYLVNKLSWRGKYARIFSIGDWGLTTYNPTSMVITNQWLYCDVLHISKVERNNGEFTILVRKGKKPETMKFCSEHRDCLLTDALQAKLNADRRKDVLRYNGYKHHWSGTRLPVILEVTPYSLDQVEPTTGQVLASYNYKDMEGLAEIQEHQAFAVITGSMGRKHIFLCDRWKELLEKVVYQAGNFMGVEVKYWPKIASLEDTIEYRLGKYSGDEHVTSLAEFLVHKLSVRQPDPVKRMLCLSETCLLERDLDTYTVVTLKPLADVHVVVRNNEDDQHFALQMANGSILKYKAADRDCLLATLLDAVRASGNRDVHVRSSFLERGLRMGPWTTASEAEVESMHLKLLHQPPTGVVYSEAVKRFNANVSFSGLLYATSQDGFFADNKDKLIQNCLMAIVQREEEDEDEAEEHFHALRRLVASKIGFGSFTSLPGFREKFGLKVVRVLREGTTAASSAALDCLCALMEPMHEDYDLRQEQLNKASLLSSPKFLDGILDMWAGHVVRGTGALVVQSVLDFLTFALCAPYSETTDGSHFDSLLERISNRGKELFLLLQHPSLSIVKGTGLIMKALIQEGDGKVCQRMQALALEQAALPQHLHDAFFCGGTGVANDRSTANQGRTLVRRQLSRRLLALWTTNNEEARQLLSRILPMGLLAFLLSDEKVPTEVDALYNRDNLKLAVDHAQKNRKNAQWVAVERQLKVVEKYVAQHVEKALEHWRAKNGSQRRQREEKMRERPIVLRRRRELCKADANWDLLFYKFHQDHNLPDLIWNAKTREELREALEGELRAFHQDRDLSGGEAIAWNYSEFEVVYPSLVEEIKVGDYFLRLLLEQGHVTDKQDLAKLTIQKPLEFFNELYHRFLLASKPSLKILCLQAMTLVYGFHYKEIGLFADTKAIVAMLNQTFDLAERDWLVRFISKLVLHPGNAKELVHAQGIPILVDLLTLAHLHVKRAVLATQSNVIEASAEMLESTEKEWYYQSEPQQQKGPVSYAQLRELKAENGITAQTKVWAAGMEGWKPLQNVSQLRWKLLGTGHALLTETDLAILILNILIQVVHYYPTRHKSGAVIRPLPKAIRLVTDASILPHIVQLLLTFDPTLVEKVAILLEHCVADNPILPRLYASGLFFFLLMYTGSNVLPIARLLALTHNKQALPISQEMGPIRSVLTHLLPQAMICFLEHHGPEKFAEIYLGEFDTPEVIWGAEMRRLMMEKIACHLADFTPRLLSNSRALYQYCPMPALAYPQLEKELFCHAYYLRHLCDTVHFPNWPIREPVNFLKTLLDAWKAEVEKKPCSLTTEDAYRILGLRTDNTKDSDTKSLDDATIRKAYFRLAQKYHPDKNPEGRAMFEEVNRAYQFLCTRSVRSSEGPDPQNIYLLLQAQGILFQRHGDELAAYKYPGYPMLTRTLRLEIDDAGLFSKPVSLLVAATQLAYHTVHTSALNAEELRREGGLEILAEALSRCVSVVGKSSKPDDSAVLVCQYVVRCIGVSARFSDCRVRIIAIGSLAQDLCRLLYYKHLSVLCMCTASSVAALCQDAQLQEQLLRAGALWHLLLLLFHYDYTLEESGVQSSTESNQQAVANQVSVCALKACARLAGFLKGEEASPANPVAQSALHALLTPYITSRLDILKPEEILKLLTSNSETPVFLWDNGTRAQLFDYVQQQRNSHVRSGESEADWGASFKFEAYSQELIVGGVFLRLYNAQPSFPVENGVKFAVDLLEFVRQQVDNLKRLSQSVQTLDITAQLEQQSRKLGAALQAFYNLLVAQPNCSLQCLGRFPWLFPLVSQNWVPALLPLQVMDRLVQHVECRIDIGAAHVLGHLLLAVHSISSSSATAASLPLALNVLHALMGQTALVKEALDKGAVLFTLNVFVHASEGAWRVRAAEVLARMTGDKLHGPKVRLQLLRFLPALFVDAMRDVPETALSLMDGHAENPELIWNEEKKLKLSQGLRILTEKHERQLKANPQTNFAWEDTENVDLPSGHDGEVTVCGVYLRLLVANPGWVLRKPREFLVAMMDATLEALNKDPSGQNCQLHVQALISLLQAQPNLLDLLPAMGHMPALLRTLQATHQVEEKTASVLAILQQVARSNVCVENLSRLEVMKCLHQALKIPQVQSQVCSFVDALTQPQASILVLEELTQQALESNLIPALLNLLTDLHNPHMTSQSRAHLVAALKAMVRASGSGSQVLALLEACPHWNQYQHQNHALFLSPSSGPAIMGATTLGVAGYLTEGKIPGAQTTPPPPSPHPLL